MAQNKLQELVYQNDRQNRQGAITPLSKPLEGKEAFQRCLELTRSLNGSRELYLKLGSNQFVTGQFSPDGDFPIHKTYKTGDGPETRTTGARLGSAYDYIRRWSEQNDGGVFYIPTQPQGYPGKDAVTHSDDIAAELDDGTPQQQWDKIDEFVAISGLYPSFILHSGKSSYHSHWKGTEHFPIAQTIYLRKLLCIALDSDPAITNPHQPMRIPGFYRKEKGNEQKLFYWSENRYTYEEFIAGFKRFFEAKGIPWQPEISDDRWRQYQKARRDGNLEGAIAVLEKSEEAERAERERKERERQQRRAERQRQRQIYGLIGADSIEDALERATDVLNYEDIFDWEGHHFKPKSHSHVVGYCPQHNSQSGTSFQVNTKTYEWKCFGCDIGGGPVQYRDFLNGGTGLPEGKDFIEVARELCHDAEVEFPELHSNRDLILEYEKSYEAAFKPLWEAENGSEVGRDSFLQQKAHEFWDWLRRKVNPIPIPFRGFDLNSPKNTKTKVEKIRYRKDPLPPPDAIDGEITFEFEPGDRLSLVQELIQLGWTDILDRSFTGSGKSHDLAQIASENGKSWYLYSDHRNPTVAPAEENTDLESRHTGLEEDHSRHTPYGNPFQRRWYPREDKPNPDIGQNCHQADRFNELANKGYDVHTANHPVKGSDATDNIICAGCDKREACIVSGYKAGRRDALKSPAIRAHPTSLPNPGTDENEHDYSQDILIWEEAETLFQPTQTRTLTKEDINTQFNWIEEAYPDYYEWLKPIKHNLNAILDGRIKVPHFGATSLPDAEEGANLHHLLGMEAYSNCDEETIKTALNLIELLIEEKAGQLTAENLADFRDQKINRDGLTQAERKYWKNAIRLAEQHLYSETAKHNDSAIGHFPTLGLYELLAILFASKTDRWTMQAIMQPGMQGAIRVSHGQVNLTLEFSRYRKIADAAKVNLYADATVDPNHLAAMRRINRINRSQLAVIQQKQPDFSNLTVHAVHTEGMGSRQYSNDCKQRQKALVQAIKEEQHPGEDTRVIAWKDSDYIKMDGYWFLDSRSTNRFQGTPNLIALGSPNPNYGLIKDEYYTIYGTLDGFEDYFDSLRQAEIKQLIGRQRPHLYPDQDFHVYLICSNLDFTFLEEMGIEVTYQEGIELTPYAGKSRQQTIMKLIKLVLNLGESFRNMTQSDLAEQLGVSQKNVSEILNQFTTIPSGTQLKWKDRLKLLYRSLYKRFMGTGIKQQAGIDHQTLMQNALHLNELRQWLKVPPELVGTSISILQETVYDAVLELTRLIESGEDITQFDDIRGFHPLFITSLALELSPPE